MGMSNNRILGMAGEDIQEGDILVLSIEPRGSIIRKATVEDMPSKTYGHAMGLSEEDARELNIGLGLGLPAGAELNMDDLRKAVEYYTSEESIKHPDIRTPKRFRITPKTVEIIIDYFQTDRNRKILSIDNEFGNMIWGQSFTVHLKHRTIYYWVDVGE